MLVKMRRFDPLKLLILFFVISTNIATKINGLNPRKLDETTVPIAPGEKCTTCCNTCTPSPPPPPPPSPPPPSPPPTPKKPPSPYCPPPPGVVPPPPSFIYINGPPGNLYPVDQDFSGAGRSFAVGLPLLVGCALFGLLAF